MKFKDVKWIDHYDCNIRCDVYILVNPELIELLEYSVTLHKKTRARHYWLLEDVHKNQKVTLDMLFEGMRPTNRRTKKEVFIYKHSEYKNDK